MRGGGGDGAPHIAAALNNWATAWSNGGNIVGGCGPSCSANDGSLRVRGKVDDRDVDLKLGGTQTCPCAEHGGCDTTHCKARSRSRSRRRREKRECRKARKQDGDADRGCSEGEQSRGRRRKRQSSHGAEGVSSGMRAEFRKAQEDIEKLNNGYWELKERILNLPGFPAHPEHGLPVGRRFFAPEYNVGGSDFDSMPMRPSRPRPMYDLADIEDVNMSPNINPLGRMSRRPLGPGMDPGFDRRPLDLSNGLQTRRERPGVRRTDTVPLGKWDDLDDLDEELRASFPRNFGPRGPGGNRARSRGMLGRRPPLSRRATNRERDQRQEHTIFGGLQVPDEQDEEERDIC